MILFFNVVSYLSCDVCRAAFGAYSSWDSSGQGGVGRGNFCRSPSSRAFTDHVSTGAGRQQGGVVGGVVVVIVEIVQGKCLWVWWVYAWGKEDQEDSQQGESGKAVLTNAVRQSPPASGCSDTFVYTAHNDCETMHYPRTWCTDFCLSIFGGKVGNMAESCLRAGWLYRAVVCDCKDFEDTVLGDLCETNCVIGNRHVSTDTIEVRRCDT